MFIILFKLDRKTGKLALSLMGCYQLENHKIVGKKQLSNISTEVYKSPKI